MTQPLRPLWWRPDCVTHHPQPSLAFHIFPGAESLEIEYPHLKKGSGIIARGTLAVRCRRRRILDAAETRSKRWCGAKASLAAGGQFYMGLLQIDELR
jgi:hypothetical protein